MTFAQWATFIYKSVPVSNNSRAGRTALDICASVDPIEMVACDMVYMTDSHCHYGDFTVANGSLVPSGASWELYVKQGKEYCSISPVTSKGGLRVIQIRKLSENGCVDFRTRGRGQKI